MTRVKLVGVVDDEHGVAEVLQAILQDAGYRVHTAIDGRHAIESMLQELPDVMLVDVMMPTMDGPELLAAMQSDERLRAVPVILMSSLEPGVIERRAKGHVAFLRKPFRIDELLALVARYTASGRE